MAASGAPGALRRGLPLEDSRRGGVGERPPLTWKRLPPVAPAAPLPNLSHVSSGIPNVTPTTAAPRQGTQPLAVGTEDGIKTWTNQSYRQSVTRETRHALFVTNPSTTTETNQRQEVLRFLKETANEDSKGGAESDAS